MGRTLDFAANLERQNERPPLLYMGFDSKRRNHP